MDIQGYAEKSVKPWNVREGDILVLEDRTRGPYVTHIPVQIVAISKYPQFYRETHTKRTSRTEWRFDHKPVNPADRGKLYDWWSTRWNSLDVVDIYRKQDK